MWTKKACIGPSAILFYCPSGGVWVICHHPPIRGDCPLSHPPNVLLCGFVHNTIYCALVLLNPQKLLPAEFLKQSTYFVKEGQYIIREIQSFHLIGQLNSAILPSKHGHWNNVCMPLYFGYFPTWPFYWDIFQHLTWGKIQLYKFSMINSDIWHLGHFPT